MPELSARGPARSAASPLPSGDGHQRTQAARNLVDGSWVPAATRGTYERHNPARPAELIGRFPDSGSPDVEAAARAAEAAVEGWGRRPSAERAAILDAAASLAHQRRGDRPHHKPRDRQAAA